MMASAQEMLTVSEVLHCYHCGSESTESSFKYFDNKKTDQPRYQCHDCQKFFTVGSHGGRQRGKTYVKKRNEDPEELKSLSRHCCHCGVADHAVFKYYNNNSSSQPRFKCLSCGKQFQMRLFGTGEEKRLVHTSSSNQTRAPRRHTQKQGVLAIEPGAGLLPEIIKDEDAEFSNFLETELTDEDNNDDPLSQTANGDNGNSPPPLSDEFAGYLQFLEDELLTEENNNEAPNYVDAFSSTTNVDIELPSAWSNEDTKMMETIEAAVRAPDVDMVLHQMAEMDSTSSNSEVMYGTLVVDRPTASESDSSSISYADDGGAACCQQMDMDVDCENSTLTAAAPERSSSSSACSIMVFADPFRVIPEPLLVEQALKEDEQCFDFPWDEGDDAEHDTDSSYCSDVYQSLLNAY